MNAPLDPAALSRVSLEDKYTLERGRVFLTGLQAIARLAMLQRVRDLRAGRVPRFSSPQRAHHYSA